MQHLQMFQSVPNGRGVDEVPKWAWCQGSDKVPTSFNNNRVLLFMKFETRGEYSSKTTKCVPKCDNKLLELFKHSIHDPVKFL